MRARHRAPPSAGAVAARTRAGAQRPATPPQKHSVADSTARGSTRQHGLRTEPGRGASHQRLWEARTSVADLSRRARFPRQRARRLRTSSRGSCRARRFPGACAPCSSGTSAPPTRRRSLERKLPERKRKCVSVCCRTEACAGVSQAVVAHLQVGLSLRRQRCPGAALRPTASAPLAALVGLRRSCPG